MLVWRECWRSRSKIDFDSEQKSWCRRAYKEQFNDAHSGLLKKIVTHAKLCPNMQSAPVGRRLEIQKKGCAGTSRGHRDSKDCICWTSSLSEKRGVWVQGRARRRAHGVLRLCDRFEDVVLRGS